MRFVSLDFETANLSDASICAVGLVVWEEGRMIDSFYQLIHPPVGYGWFREEFIAIHGIRHSDVTKAPSFEMIYPKLLERVRGACAVVVHNMPFDRRKLLGTLNHFGLPTPDWPWICSLSLSRRAWPSLADHQLHTVSEYIGHRFVHHHACEDAQAAGLVFLAAHRELAIINNSPTKIGR